MSYNFTVKFRFLEGFSNEDLLRKHVCSFREDFLFYSISDNLGYYRICLKTLRAAKRFFTYLRYDFQDGFCLAEFCIYSHSAHYRLSYDLVSNRYRKVK